MVFNGIALILDNFREVLKDYSVDVQDVVRSAILDGVDIGVWIDVYKEEPYKLDQIRLALKEGLNSKFFNLNTYEQLYKVRYLKKNDCDLSAIEELMSKGYISDNDLIDTMLSWSEQGYDLSKIDVTLIPKEMYAIFELGFKKGYDMSVFNDGRKYSSDYVWNCFVLLANGKDVNPFVKTNLYDIECLKSIATFSKVASGVWNRFVSCLSYNMPLEKVKIMEECAKTKLPIDIFKSPKWSADAIRVIIKAYERGTDYNKLIECSTDVSILEMKLNELIVQDSKKVRGRLRKTN